MGQSLRREKIRLRRHRRVGRQDGALEQDRIRVLRVVEDRAAVAAKWGSTGFRGLKAWKGFGKRGWPGRMKSSRWGRRRIRARSPPRKGMLPAVGATMLRIMRARVVLPLPDSPTMVKISGCPA